MHVAVQLEFKANRKELMPPSTARDASRQYPIGDTANWQQIVANIATIVDELARTFVAEIEAAVEPAPEWFETSF